MFCCFSKSGEIPCESCLAFLIREYSILGMNPEGLPSAVCAESPSISCRYISKADLILVWIRYFTCLKLCLSRVFFPDFFSM